VHVIWIVGSPVEFIISLWTFYADDEWIDGPGVILILQVYDQCVITDVSIMNDCLIELKVLFSLSVVKRHPALKTCDTYSVGITVIHIEDLGKNVFENPTGVILF
jgi:hypothetical protein